MKAFDFAEWVSPPPGTPRRRRAHDARPHYRLASPPTAAGTWTWWSTISGSTTTSTRSSAPPTWPTPSSTPRTPPSAAERMGVTPRHLVYVGDTDVDGEAAAAAGMRFGATVTPEAPQRLHRRPARTPRQVARPAIASRRGRSPTTPRGWSRLGHFGVAARNRGCARRSSTTPAESRATARSAGPARPRRPRSPTRPGGAALALQRRVVAKNGLVGRKEEHCLAGRERRIEESVVSTSASAYQYAELSHRRHLHRSATSSVG